tara:strand:+ start:1397 stop:2530 length:1134 start_codon:yes stop_codon:yes gene_type:complete
MRKIRILHIIPSLEIGGAETFMYRLVNQDKNNYHFILCLKDKGFYGKKLEEEGYAVFELNLGINLNFFKVIQNLNFIFRSHKPEILNCWMYHGALFGTLISFFYKVKGLFWLIRHSELNLKSTKISTLVVAKLCAFLSKNPKSIIYNSEESRNVHENSGYDQQKSLVIGNGFMLDKFYPDKADRFNLRKILNIPESTFVFLHVARWHKDKDHETCLKSLALFQSKHNIDWKIIFVGTGMNKTNAKLQELIVGNNLSDRCILLGERPNTKELYNAADLTLLTSITESFPNVIGESMACTTPCISSDVGNVRGLLLNQNWIFPIKDHNQMSMILTKAILLKSKPEEWLKCKSESRSLIERKFSFEKVLSLYQSNWKASI